MDDASSEIEQLKHKIDQLEAELSAYKLLFGETYQRSNNVALHPPGDHDPAYAKRNP